MITISNEQNVLTLISVFEVLPENQENLLKLLVSCTDQFVADCAGFISASYHCKSSA
ncbi:hypothetical protein HCX49_08595 [Sphingobacterium kitahiroshimense]|uniref:hypothetical protein n=1 Tax=Sphingobacterium sp. B16(2022) TaxID=2914044 RepID=UPI00143B9194|nr:hypothetical protein [Sphingobacterium sp. B16(2022)]NJI73261.1 hypothetical protein [Sphingobacterium sp. B16(2022)]